MSAAISQSAESIPKASRAAHGQLRHNWQLDLHRHQSTISLAAVALHVVGLIFDSYVHFGVTDILIPGAAGWKTTPVAFGVIAMYVLLVVQGTSMARNRLSKRVWKTVHLSSLGAYVLSTLHFATAGTDRNSVPLQWLILGVSLANMACLSTEFWRAAPVLSECNCAPDVTSPRPRRLGGKA